MVASADRDEVFHWGRDVDVDWKAVIWITVRDQVRGVALIWCYLLIYKMNHSPTESFFVHAFVGCSSSLLSDKDSSGQFLD